MFSRTDRSGTMPSRLRSSVQKPRPAAMASRGSAGTKGRPSSAMVPPSGRSAPNSSRTLSVRPEPSSPDRPTISPAPTLKLTSETNGARARLRASTTGRWAPCRFAPKPVAPPLATARRSRPSMVATRSSLGISAMGPLRTVAPSRMTVTRSQTA